MKPQFLIKGYSYGLYTSAPKTTDNTWPVDYIWVDVAASIAYILLSMVDGVATWIVKNPDSIINDGTGGQVNVIGEKVINVRTMGTGTSTSTDVNAIHSYPGSREYKVDSIKILSDGKISVRYDDVPLP